MKLFLAFALVGFWMNTAHADTTTHVTVRDLHGLDGCGFELQLDSGKYLEPLNLPKEYQVNGKSLEITYHEELEGASVCMIGSMVTLDTILPKN